eukprot:m.102435 g.102435  ORF g.102435 m.102435 type:complete len:509 (+) comp37174_c0_seq14:200-1726(+)
MSYSEQQCSFPDVSGNSHNYVISGSLAEGVLLLLLIVVVCLFTSLMVVIRLLREQRRQTANHEEIRKRDLAESDRHSDDQIDSESLECKLEWHSSNDGLRFQRRKQENFTCLPRDVERDSGSITDSRRSVCLPILRPSLDYRNQTPAQLKLVTVAFLKGDAVNAVRLLNGYISRVSQTSFPVPLNNSRRCSVKLQNSSFESLHLINIICPLEVRILLLSFLAQTCYCSTGSRNEVEKVLEEMPRSLQLNYVAKMELCKGSSVSEASELQWLEQMETECLQEIKELQGDRESQLNMWTSMQLAVLHNALGFLCTKRLIHNPDRRWILMKIDHHKIAADICGRLLEESIDSIWRIIVLWHLNTFKGNLSYAWSCLNHFPMSLVEQKAHAERAKQLQVSSLEDTEKLHKFLDMGDYQEAMTITSYRDARFNNMVRNVRLLEKSVTYPDIIAEYIICEKEIIESGFGRMRQGALDENAEALHQEMIQAFASLIENVRDRKTVPISMFNPYSV